MSAFSGSSRSFASTLPCLLKVSTAVLKAPLVSLPMHQVTLPEAFLASDGCSVFPSAGGQSKDSKTQDNGAQVPHHRLLLSPGRPIRKYPNPVAAKPFRV